MYKGFLHTHYLVVTLFLLLYIVKTVLLLSNKTEALQKFTKKTRIFEMVISFLFLITGVFLLTQLPVIGTLMWIKIAVVLASIPVAVVGFRKGKKALAALSLLMLFAAFGMGEVYHKHPPVAQVKPAAGADSSMAALDGKSLYEANCALCHGNDGKLGMAGALDLSKTALDVPGIREVIVNGRGAMPPAQVTNEQAAAIADYVNGNIKGK